NWKGAETALDYAIYYCDKNLWENNYTTAYDYLAHSRAKLGRAQKQIDDLKARLENPPRLPVDRFELATLYLWTGNPRAAIAQYNLLKNTDPSLANALNDLLKKHRVRTRDVKVGSTSPDHHKRDYPRKD